ncbi:Uncharacterised protein [uncultured archaeon]|nr:Uncharacterised protein [uncultured archaeon]
MDWKKIITILLIVAFAGEIVVLSFTSTSAPANNTTETSVPTSTPAPVLFSGKGYSQIQILNLSGKGYFQCAGETTDLTQIINNSKLFDSISRIQPGFYRITAPINLTSEEFTSKQVKLETLVKKYCNSTLTYRLGSVRLLLPEVNFTSTDGRSQVISTTQLENYFYDQGSTVNALLIPTFKVNESGYAEMYTSTHDYAIDPSQGDVVIIEQINPFASLFNQNTSTDNTTTVKTNNTNSTVNSTVTVNTNSTKLNQTK